MRGAEYKYGNVARPLQASEYTREAMLDAITIPVGPRLGDVVVEAKGLKKTYGERTLMDGLSFSIPPASIVGAGQLCLLCMLSLSRMLLLLVVQSATQDHGRLSACPVPIAVYSTKPLSHPIWIGLSLVPREPLTS